MLRNRDFQSLWINQFLSSVSKEATEVAYPLLILATTGSVTFSATVGAAQMVAAGLTAILGGWLADRRDRRLTLIGCDLTRAALLLALCVLIATGHAGTLTVFVTAVGSAVCVGIANPAALAAVKHLVPPSQLTRATAQNQIRPHAAMTLGSPIGGSLFALGRAVPFLASAVLFVLSTVALLFVTRPMQQARTVRGHDESGNALAGYRAIRAQPIIFLWLLWVVGSNMAFNHTGTFIALIATARDRGATEPTIGVMLAIAGAGGLAGALVASWVVRRLSPSAVFAIAAWLGPAATVALMVLPGTVTLGVVVACVFARAPAVNALFYAYVAVLIPDWLQGRVLGLAMFVSLFSTPLGILGVGLIFDLAGATWVFAAMGVLSTAAAIPTLTRRMRTLPRPEHLATAP
ncbi:MFS transporter [Actinophytocola xinjiangensis]|uniref:MFS transporter n=1 Tax=Actinophytocola xinjiangensis TaxID=485602 RepID=UPI0013903953|nr:MFS transporter [Actinophytocola xinjiangensis]